MRSSLSWFTLASVLGNWEGNSAWLFFSVPGRQKINVQIQMLIYFVHMLWRQPEKNLKHFVLLCFLQNFTAVYSAESKALPHSGVLLRAHVNTGMSNQYIPSTSSTILLIYASLIQIPTAERPGVGKAAWKKKKRGRGVQRAGSL